MDIGCMAAKAEARAAVLAVMAQASVLAGKMLWSYLNEVITAETLAEVSAAVQRNATHALIEGHVQAKVHEWVNATGMLPDDVQLRELVADAVSSFRMSSPAAASAEAPSSLPARAYFSGDLQAVIGGINDIIMADARTSSNDGRTLQYQASYAIRDWYDFDNDRSMFPAYDSYRRALTATYATSPADALKAFNTDLYAAPQNGGDPYKGPLNRSLVFTCFMYALEKNGCTSSLYWQVTVPFQGAVRLAVPSPVPTPPILPPQPPQPLPRPRPKPRPPPRPAPPTQPPSSTTYVVQPGDNLTKLAKKFYGDGVLWRKIYAANRAVIGSDPNRIYPGQRFVIPP